MECDTYLPRAPSAKLRRHALLQLFMSAVLAHVKSAISCTHKHLSFKQSCSQRKWRAVGQQPALFSPHHSVDAQSRIGLLNTEKWEANSNGRFDFRPLNNPPAQIF